MRPAGCLLLAAFVVACASPPRRDLERLVELGEFGRARVAVQEGLTDDPDDRDHMLDRLRLGVTALADGVLPAAQRPLEEVYERLRTQGLNDDKTLMVALLNDRVTYWKGEPFEQAMAFLYVGMYHAMDGEWDGLRAAADSSLFHLKDFGVDPSGVPLDAEELARRDAQWDAEDRGDYIERGYRPIESNFALGYLLKGLADLEIASVQQAHDEFQKVLQLDPGLQPVVARILSGHYDTVLIVGYGRGPQKVATGLDGAIADFAPVTPSDDSPLWVSVAGRPREAFPIACDLNAMARDHLWRGLEDVRLAKSYIGGALMAAGFGMGAYAGHHRDPGLAMVAFATSLLGMASRSAARADTTYCEALPQRVYVVPLALGDAGDVELEVANHPVSRLRLKAVPAAGAVAQLRYVHLVSAGVGWQAPFWAMSGDLHYCNDAVDLGRPHVPYILGGACACTPTYARLGQAQQAGYLPGLDLARLIDLYHAEGIRIAGLDPGPIGLHVLEGGDWLYTPIPGTAGFARLYGQPHDPYPPRSDALREYLATLPPAGP